MATLPGDNGRRSPLGGRIPRPPNLDRYVRAGRGADDIYAMCGYYDGRTNRTVPGDGVPRVVRVDDGWVLAVLMRRDGETVLTLHDLPDEIVTEDEALALALLYLAGCEECEGAAA